MAQLFVRAWREHRGMTTEQLANRIEMSVATVSRLESGDKEWTSSQLDALAEALGCQPKDLLSSPE
jgi:DNA-binding Xre family transcriptional regulator